jgi:hypothetical protein
MGKNLRSFTNETLNVFFRSHCHFIFICNYDITIKTIKIHKNILHYLIMDGIIEFFLLEIFFIINNDYIPILPTKLSITYLIYIGYVKK